MTTYSSLWSNFLHQLNLLRNIQHCIEVAPPQDAYRAIDTPFTFINCANFKPANQQLQLLSFFNILRQQTEIPLQLILIGHKENSEYKQQLQQHITDLALDDTVQLTLLAQKQSLLPLYRQSDIYLSIAQDRLNGALLDAILQHLPIINLHKGLGQSNLALLSYTFSGGDTAAWASQIVALLGQPRQRRAIAHDHYQQLGHCYQQQSRWLGKLFQIFRGHSNAALYKDSLKNVLAFRVEGPFDSNYSLALVNRELASALAQKDPDQVGLYSTEGPGDYTANPDFLQRHPTLSALSQNAIQTPAAKCTLRLLYPPRVSNMQGRYNAISCYGWEESSFPQEHVTQFNLYLDFATSMSRYVTGLLQDNGVTCPLFTTGIGVDHILKHPIDSSSLPAMPKRCLKLLHISSCFPRKGVDVLLKAYGQQFNAQDNICLIIKTFANPHHDIEQQLQQWQQTLSSAPQIMLINQDLSDSAIRALYEAADALVGPSRGEGFGLPMAEAMLHKLPVITTGYGGQRDFANEENAWLIDYQFARAKSHMQQTNSVWVEPDPRHLGSLLGSFYGAYCQGNLTAFTADRVERAALDIQAHTWQQVAQRTEKALQKVEELPLELPTPKLAVVTTWHSQCGIATYSELLLQHAFPNSLILANTDASLMQADDARVIRCWKTGVEDDLQYLEQCIIEQSIDQVLIQFNFSFFALPALKHLMQNLLDQKIQVLLTLHSSADVYWGEELKTIRDLQPTLGNIERIFVHSVADLNRLKSFNLVENVSLFAHGVQHIDTQSSVVPLASEHYQQAAQQMTERNVIASYGFLLPHKGISQLIESFAQLLQTRENIHLLLVTALYPAEVSQTYYQHCQDLIEQYQLEDKVTFITDYLSDEHSRAWLNLADLIVYAYQQTQESSSAAVRWGLALEKPVFCTPLGIFEDVASAVHWLPGISPTDISQGISEALDNPQQLTEKHAAQKKWLDEHNWRYLFQRLNNQLKALKTSQLTS